MFWGRSEKRGSTTTTEKALHKNSSYVGEKILSRSESDQQSSAAKGKESSVGERLLKKKHHKEPPEFLLVAEYLLRLEGGNKDVHAPGGRIP